MLGKVIGGERHEYTVSNVSLRRSAADRCSSAPFVRVCAPYRRTTCAYRHVGGDDRRLVHAFDPDGTTVTDQTYRGKWLLVYFGYTFCPNSCPTTLLEIAIALKKLGPDAAQVQPLFITVDPQRDTPK